MFAITFYPVGGYQLQIADDSVGGFSRERIFESARFVSTRKLSALSEFVSRKSVEDLGVSAKFEKYYVYRQEDITLLIPADWLIFSWLLRRRIRKCVRYALEKVSLFRLWAREDLLRVVLSADADLGAHLEALRRYTFFDDYTLWEFNRDSEVFVCICSSREMKKDFISKSEKSSLNDVLSDGYSFEARKAKKQRFISFEGEQTPFLVRVKLNFGTDRSIGVLSLYTSKYGFSLSEKTLAQIKRAVESKYSDSLRQSQGALIGLNQLILDSVRSKDELTAFLYKFVNAAAEAFSFEACSIFILDKEGGGLRLIAQHDLLHDGEPTEEVIYPLGMQNSLTIKVFNEKKTRWSYDLARDGENSHRYSEKTKLQARNWIGVPLVNSNNGSVVGVIRFKNKFRWIGSELRMAHLTYDDFRSIAAIIMHLNNYLSLNAVLDGLQKSNDELTRFLRIFMHEIRAPISTFSNAPEKIRDIIDEVDFKDKRKVHLFLDDIKAMGARLKFLTDAYSVTAIVGAKSIQRLSFLEDIYYPVMNIAKHHHERVSGVVFVADQSQMHGVKVLADKVFGGIVLNALIDNAVKYADEDGKVVRVSSEKKEEGFFDLIIENDGIGVCDDELEAVFEEGRRGRLAEQQKVPGYGIGLAISRRLMREIGGDLIIESGINPFKIRMRIPLEV